MSKRARRPKPVGPSKRRRDNRKPVQRRSRSGQPDLLRDVALALADDHPLAMLALVSSLLAALDPRCRSPFDTAPEPGVPSHNELIQTFLEVDLPETSALLAVIAELVGDDMLRRRIRREITSRAHTLPRWLVDLSRAEPVERVVEVVHVLGDGDDIVLGVRLPGGQELSIVVYIDHNLGTVVKDGFVVPEPLPALVEVICKADPGPDTTANDVDPADAKARITEAIETGAITFPPLETDSWPGCRPLVEWAVRMLPAGGTGYRRPDWDDDALQALADRFLASPFGTGLDDPDHRGLLESLLWFGTGYGPGDPLRWSPVAVEILLADWIPRKLVADAPYLAKAPALLRAFIRFCHDERGIRPALTAETIDAVDEFESHYQQTIRSPRPQGPAALLAAMGALEPDSPWPLLDAGPADSPEIVLDAPQRDVGSEDL